MKNTYSNYLRQVIHFIIVLVIFQFLCACGCTGGKSGDREFAIATNVESGLLFDRKAIYETGKHPWYNTEHHIPDGGYANIYPEGQRKPSFWKAFTWIVGKILAPDKSEKMESTPADIGLLNENILPGKYRVFWPGHASVLIRTAKGNVITDPIFSLKASPVTFTGPDRVSPLPLKMEDLPVIDYVIISHNHYDHLDENTILFLNKRDHPVFLVPVGLKTFFEKRDIHSVVELDWGMYAKVGKYTFHSVPAQHFSSRTPFDRNETLWTGWIIDLPDNAARIYFAGDTGYGPFYDDIGRHFPGIDLALIPIGAYKPAWLMKSVHINPGEALQVMIDLNAKEMLGIHHSTYRLAEEPLSEPASETNRLSKERELDKRVHVLRPGEFLPGSGNRM